MPSWSLTRRWNRSWFGILSFMLMALPASAQQPAGLEPDQSGSGLSGHWSFQRFMRPVAPKVNDQGWVQTPVDAFVLARLEEQGLRPSPPADKHTLIRRVWLDLLGLPPTQQDVAEFLADDRHDAYERLVDRLLASEHYGERWARPWLDLARYAESNGFKSDEVRPHAWRYRDYVIRSLNEDKPYDRFIREQIAGDEVAPRDSQALIATGFNRHWPDESNARNLVLRRQEILNDITDTTASVFLGLSLGCARCHDHKYDPLTQMDYYRFQAFFAASEPTETIAIAGLDPEASRAQFQEWEQATAPIRQEMESIEDPVRRRMQKDTIDKFVPEVQEALSVEASARSPLQSQLANLAETHMDITTDAMVGKMSKDDRDRWTKLRDSLKELDRLKPAGSGVAMTVHDVGRTAPPTYLLRRGLYNAPEEEVAPGFPSYFDTTPASVPARADEATSTGRRTVLADWIADSRNPFTTRVVVNRLWQGHFGRGIVGTPSDFGKQGDQPTHPDLLDWLATELVDQGWSLKAMHRLLVTSNTYRQTSQVVDGQERAREIDPDNMMLWRMNRQRLDAEVIRDTMLSVSGTINFEAGGPSIHPELPAGLSDRYGWKPSEQIDQRHRRSIYVFVRRNLRYPLFELFDMPDTNETCGRRSRTTTPPQALFILNSDLVLNYAKAFAGRILREAGNDPYLAITTAYRIAFGRDPCDEEIASSSEFLRRQADLVREQADSVSKLALPSPMPEGYDPCSGAALTDLCHVLLNANEFVYVD